MLSRLASGQAPTRRDVAQRLGGPRQPIGPWRARDARGGLDTLLDLYVPPGQPLSRPPEGRAALAQAPRPPAGCASAEALRQWGQQTSPLEVNAHTRSTLVRPKLTATRKVPRPRHTTTP
jgi:hypothetical protein